MKYSKMLREQFPGITLNVEDLFHLETFQIKFLPERVPEKEFSVLLRANPCIQRFLIKKDSTIEGFINEVLKKNIELSDKNTIDELSQELLWEIADLIIYNKYPEIYYSKVDFPWRIDEIINKEELKGKVVADVGAGSGILAFLLAEYAKTVFAIEPVRVFRNFIREKADKEGFSNVYTIDGFLDSLPFPENSFDFLITSNAIGWNIDKELQEIERVVKPGGQAIHIMRIKESLYENPVHDKLISSKWKYNFQKENIKSGIKLKYTKFL
jgi:SAM-dependent methyltransferase